MVYFISQDDTRASYMINSFTYTAKLEWNRLPSDLKKISNLDKFKAITRAYLFESYWFYDLFTVFTICSLILRSVFWFLRVYAFCVFVFEQSLKCTFLIILIRTPMEISNVQCFFGLSCVKELVSCISSLCWRFLRHLCETQHFGVFILCSYIYILSMRSSFTKYNTIQYNAYSSTVDFIIMKVEK